MHNIRASLAMLVLQRALCVCATILFIVYADGILHAQRPTYTIEVTLDTVTHELSGFVDMTYTNTSPGPMDSLAIHLWANAYANKNTTFAKQLLHLGTLNFNNAKPEEMGGYKKLFFSSSDDSFEFHFDPDHIDIGWIIPSHPLAPGKTIHFTATFV